MTAAMIVVGLLVTFIGVVVHKMDDDNDPPPPSNGAMP